MLTHKDSTQATREVVSRIYKSYVDGKIEEATFGFSTDVDWAILAPQHLFAFAGPRRGRSNVLEAFRTIAETFEFLTYDPRLILADGPNACVYSRCVVRHKETGHGTNLDLCAVMTVKDGLVTWFREFVDSASVAFNLSGSVVGES
jgi:ketosteroid isomerase-like protein